MQLWQRPRGPYSKTPLRKRWPVLVTIWLSIAAAAVFTPDHDFWAFLLIYAGTTVLVALAFHFVFRQPWARLLMYREYDNADGERCS